MLVPTSGCNNALALHKGFSELRALGWIASVTPIAALAALDETARARMRGQTIVWIGTGTGKNQIEAPLAQCSQPPRLGDLDAFAKLNPTLADANASA